MKDQALTAYGSQQVALRPIRRLLHYSSRLYGKAGGVEVFWEMTTAAYARLIAAGDWTGRPTPFRGVHQRPFTDPLAYLVGLKERRRLRNVERRAWSVEREAIA